MRERVIYLPPVWTFYGGMSYKGLLGAQSDTQSETSRMIIVYMSVTLHGR